MFRLYSYHPLPRTNGDMTFHAHAHQGSSEWPFQLKGVTLQERRRCSGGPSLMAPPLHSYTPRSDSGER
jgi:hypothetical protein